MHPLQSGVASRVIATFSNSNPLMTLTKSPFRTPHAHASVVTLALAFVTLTPNCFALARISILFLDETAWEILLVVSGDGLARLGGFDVLGGKGAVMHEEKVNVADVVDEEGLVARGHHVAGLLVGAVSDLHERRPSA